MQSKDASSGHPLVQITHASHAYRMGSQSVSVLRDVTLEIHPGETCALLGASGSGKSTLLNILGLLDRPSAGQFLFRGRDMLGIDENARACVRNREIGFVFQSFNLLPRMNALDNVALPLFYRGIPRAQARAMAMDWLRQVGLADRGGHLPADLSGGSASGSPLPVPWLAIPPSFLRTNRPVIWIRLQPTASWPCSWG